MATNETKPAPRPNLPNPGKPDTHGAPKPPPPPRPTQNTVARTVKT